MNAPSSSEHRPFDAVTARRRLLVAALATLTADLAEQSGMKDEDHPRRQNDLRDLAFASADYVRAVDALHPSLQPLGWQS